MQARPGTPPSYIKPTICRTWYVQAPGNVLQAVVLITRQLALEGDRQKNTKKRKSWFMEPNDLSAGLSAITRKKSSQEMLSHSWETCQVCLTPPVLHSSVFSRWKWKCGCVYTHTHRYIYIYMYIYIYIFIHMEELLDKAESHSTAEKIESDRYGQNNERQSTNHEADLSAEDLFQMIYHGEEDK